MVAAGLTVTLIVLGITAAVQWNRAGSRAEMKACLDTGRDWVTESGTSAHSCQAPYDPPASR
jgi:hypothetical protein